MIRIIVRSNDAAIAANVGGGVNTTYKTFDVNLPEIEEFLILPIREKWQYTERCVVGVEVIELLPKRTEEK